MKKYAKWITLLGVFSLLIASSMFINCVSSSQMAQIQAQQRARAYGEQPNYKVRKYGTIAVKFEAEKGLKVDLISPQKLKNVLTGKKDKKFSLPATLEFDMANDYGFEFLYYNVPSGTPFYGRLVLENATEITEASAVTVSIEAAHIAAAQSGEVQILKVKDPTLEEEVTILTLTLGNRPPQGVDVNKGDSKTIYWVGGIGAVLAILLIAGI